MRDRENGCVSGVIKNNNVVITNPQIKIFRSTFHKIFSILTHCTLFKLRLRTVATQYRYILAKLYISLKTFKKTLTIKG